VAEPTTTVPDDELAVVIPEHLRPVGDEQAVLGACLLSPPALDEVIAQVPTPEIFWQPGHGDVWTALVALWERGERADALTVNAELSRTGQLRGIGGPAYLHTLVASTPAIGNASHYLRRVLDAWQLRAADVALRHGRMLVGAGDGGSADVILDVAARELERARDMRHRASGAVKVGDLVDGVLSDLDDYQFEEDLRGIEAPYVDLREILNPAMPGQMICFAGRPGTGKSTVLKDYCEHTAFDLGLPSLLLTYEMKAKEITARTMSRQARVALSHLVRPGLLTDDDRARIADFRDAFAAAPFYVVDVEDTSVAELDRLIRQYGPRIVAVDYLQLAVEEGPAERRRHDVERYSRSIKKLAGRREVPILVGSQLNRASEARRDRRPHLADLRESGGIEQDCDAVVLLHREDLYEPESPRVGEADFIVAKQRNGRTGDVTLANRLHYASFADMAR
jgi:replicative DNA helicase